jgi:hypothetical protein
MIAAYEDQAAMDMPCPEVRGQQVQRMNIVA